MMTVIETRVLMLLAQSAPKALRAKTIYTQIAGAHVEIVNSLQHLYKRQLITGCVVDGVVDKLGQDDLESWRFYITKKGCEEVMRVSR